MLIEENISQTLPNSSRDTINRYINFIYNQILIFVFQIFIVSSEEPELCLCTVVCRDKYNQVNEHFYI